MLQSKCPKCGYTAESQDRFCVVCRGGQKMVREVTPE